MIWTKGAHQSEKFLTFNCSREISICTLIGSFRWKCIKFQPKKVQRSCLMTLRSDAKFEEKPICCLKMTRILWILIRAFKSPQNFHFDWSLSCKAYNIWPKKVQRIYLSWNWSAMQNLKENWLVVGKNDMRNLENFHQNTWSAKIGTLTGCFCPK